MNFETRIRQFSHYLKVERGFSERTVSAYCHDLFKFKEFVEDHVFHDLRGIEKSDIRKFMSFLERKGIQRPNSEATRARKLSTLKSFFKYLTRENYLQSNPAADIQTPKIPKKEPVYLTPEEYWVLLKTVERTASAYYTARDTAIVALLLATGMRLGELAGLDLLDLNFSSQQVKVKRKGGNEQLIPLNAEIVEILQDYLQSRRTIDHPALFVSRKGNRMARGSVYHLIKKYLKAANINKGNAAVHSLRHSVGAQLLSAGVNLVVIQELLGHKQLETTRRYTHINNVDVREAVKHMALRGPTTLAQNKGGE